MPRSQCTLGYQYAVFYLSIMNVSTLIFSFFWSISLHSLVMMILSLYNVCLMPFLHFQLKSIKTVPHSCPVLTKEICKDRTHKLTYHFLDQDTTFLKLMYFHKSLGTHIQMRVPSQLPSSSNQFMTTSHGVSKARNEQRWLLMAFLCIAIPFLLSGLPSKYEPWLSQVLARLG